MATEQELKDPQIDPTENWSTVKLRLALPEAFRMFAGGTDSFDGSTSGVFDFAESYPGDGQEKLPYDKYVRPVRNKGGKVILGRSGMGNCFNGKKLFCSWPRDGTWPGKYFTEYRYAKDWYWSTGGCTCN